VSQTGRAADHRLPSIGDHETSPPRRSANCSSVTSFCFVGVDVVSDRIAVPVYVHDRGVVEQVVDDGAGHDLASIRRSNDSRSGRSRRAHSGDVEAALRQADIYGLTAS
jgi:hypothetical protein